MTIKEMRETQMILALKKYPISQAAKILGITERTLYSFKKKASKDKRL